MIKIESGNRDTVDIIDSSNNVNQYLNIMLQKENTKETKTTTTKNINKYIYQSIRTKASIISGDQRNIQDRISLIQVQEQKIGEIEKVLVQAKREYSFTLQKGKKEEQSERIKVRQLTRQVSDLQKDAQSNEQNVQQLQENKEVYEQDSEKIVDKINEILRKITATKGEITEYKAKLIELSQELSLNKAKINKQSDELQKHLDDSDYIINGVGINTSEYTDLNGSIETGLVIDIYI